MVIAALTPDKVKSSEIRNFCFQANLAKKKNPLIVIFLKFIRIMVIDNKLQTSFYNKWTKKNKDNTFRKPLSNTKVFCSRLPELIVRMKTTGKTLYRK
jgi:hypothetical protein